MIMLDHRATKAIQGKNEFNFFYRGEGDMRRFVNYVLIGAGVIYSGCRGILYNPGNPDAMVQEMLRVQELYKKCSGVRIRHEFVTISWDELPDDYREAAIREIAEQFADTYYWRGFQVVFGIFADAGQYCIRYAINTVNYHDGSKYQGGQNTWDIEFGLLRAIVECINGGGKRVDYRGLEYYY